MPVGRRGRLAHPCGRSDGCGCGGEDGPVALGAHLGDAGGDAGGVSGRGGSDESGADGASVQPSGRENFAVGGANRWRYDSILEWAMYPTPEEPVLVYFRETQSSPAGQRPGLTRNRRPSRSSQKQSEICARFSLCFTVLCGIPLRFHQTPGTMR